MYIKSEKVEKYNGTNYHLPDGMYLLYVSDRDGMLIKAEKIQKVSR
jgi:hypothetical protein